MVISFSLVTLGYPSTLTVWRNVKYVKYSIAVNLIFKYSYYGSYDVNNDKK